MQRICANWLAWALHPSIICRWASAHDMAQGGYCIALTVPFDKVELYFISLAKKALAFVNISFFTRRVLTSWRRLLSSVRSSSDKVIPAFLVLGTLFPSIEHVCCHAQGFSHFRDGIALLRDQCHSFFFKLFRILFLTAFLRHN